MSEIICCICLEKSIFLQNVNECVFGTVSYTEKLNTCVSNELWVEAFNICNDCVDKLDSAYSFVQVCLKSQEWRKKQIKLIKLKRTLSIKPKEEFAIDFTCHHCGQSFGLKRTLSIHITRKHTRPKQNTKRKSVVLKSESNLENKIKETNLQLDICLEGKENLDITDKNTFFTNSENGKENTEKDKDMKGFDGDGYDNCLSEGDIFKENNLYKEKKRDTKCKIPLQCGFCELVFMKNHKLIHHVRAKHTFEKPFKCTLCDAKYLMQRYLKVHMRKHNNEKPYVCSTCGKSFISSNDLWRHNKIHERVRKYACDECNRSFKTNSNLRSHKLQMHQDPGLWKFVCTVCGKKFPLNNTLVNHMRRHEGIKQFSCHLCLKKFVEKIELQNHLLSHSDERNYKCNTCGKAYKKSDTLKRHLKMEHDIGNYTVKKPEKKFSCPMCPKLFEFNNKLQRHILTHTREKPVKCEYCEKRFRDNYDRSIHLRKDHNVEPKTLTSVL